MKPVSPSDEEFFEKVRRIVLDQQRELAELRASVRVLRVVVARLANKDQPQAFLADLSQWEKQVLDADSLDQQRRQSAEILEALDLLKKARRDRTRFLAIARFYSLAKTPLTGGRAPANPRSEPLLRRVKCER